MSKGSKDKKMSITMSIKKILAKKKKRDVAVDTKLKSLF